MKIIATPLARSARITLNRCSASLGVSVAVGSSSTSSRAFSDSALPISTNCCCATESWQIGTPRSICTPSSSNTARASRCMAAWSMRPKRFVR
ncbi:hypothetical protein D9M68_805750 [compost metagenome]